MEEFARGFPNQHTTHRDTRYICMQTFVSARMATGEGTYRGDDGARRRLRAITSVGVGCTRAACIHIYTRARCERMRECVHAR